MRAYTHKCTHTHTHIEARASEHGTVQTYNSPKLYSVDLANSTYGCCASVV